MTEPTRPPEQVAEAIVRDSDCRLHCEDDELCSGCTALVAAIAQAITEARTQEREKLKHTALTAFDVWRVKLPNGAFTHPDGIRFKTLLSDAFGAPHD
jgi:hypothetical protein